MNKNTIITVVLIVLAGALGFFAGARYQSKAQAALGNRQFTGQWGMRGGTGQATGRNGVVSGFRGGQILGQITATDDKSITVKMDDGSSRIVFLSDRTTINKATEAGKSDLTSGQTVAVFGTPNADGSVTAANIQLNPVLRGELGTQKTSPAPSK